MLRDYNPAEFNRTIITNSKICKPMCFSLYFEYSSVNELEPPIYTVSGKKSLQYFMCNVNKFKGIFIIFGTNHPETPLY